MSCACAWAKKDCTNCLTSKRSRCSNFVPPQNIPQLARSLCEEVMPEVSLEVVQKPCLKGIMAPQFLKRIDLLSSQRDPAITGLSPPSSPGLQGIAESGRVLEKPASPLWSSSLLSF